MERKELALKVFVSLKRVEDYFDQAVKRDVAKYGLNVNEFAVLEFLYHKGCQTVQCVKKRILIANSSTTYIIDKLCRKGLVERQHDEKDRRIIYVHLTHKGHELMVQNFLQHAQMITRQFDRLDNQQLETLHHLLKLTTGYE